MHKSSWMKLNPDWLIALLLFLPLATSAQTPDITGVWTGLLYVDSTKALLPFEMVFSEEKGKVTGFSRIVFEHEGKKEVGLRDITAKFEKGQWVIEDDDFIESDFSVHVPRRIKKTMLADITENDTAMIMKTTWSTQRTRIFLAATGSGTFYKKKDYRETAIFQRLEQLKKIEKLSFTKIQPEAVVAAATPKPVLPPPPPVVENVPDFEIKPIEPASFVRLPMPGSPRPPGRTVQPYSRLQKNLFAQLGRPKFKPAAPVVVAAAPPPRPEPQAAPVRSKPTPEPVVVKAPEPKPAVQPTVATVVPPAPKPQPVVVAPVIAPSATSGAADLDKRAIRVEQALYFDNDSLVLTLYDNGEVDGDTVTVVMNGNIVFSKQGLSTKANTKTVYIPANADSVKFIMYAENLGEIPPNTGLMVVMDGEKRYDLRFSADLKSSAAIVFRRRPR